MHNPVWDQNSGRSQNPLARPFGAVAAQGSARAERSASVYRKGAKGRGKKGHGGKPGGGGKKGDGWQPGRGGKAGDGGK